MADVFISYSSQNQREAQRLCQLLEQNQVRCWIAPRDIPVGYNYTKAIPEAISDCRFFLVMVTKAAQNSSFVLKELEFAVHSGKTIIPVIYDQHPLNNEFRFLLGVEQHLYAHAMPEEAVIRELVPRIRQRREPQPVYAPPAEPVPVQRTAGAATLTITRAKQFFVVNPSIKVSDHTRTVRQLPNGETITCSYPAGNVVLNFSCGIRRTKVLIPLLQDSHIQVKWDRITGKMEVEPLTPIQLQILEKC